LSRRLLLAIAGVGAVAVVALLALAWQPAIPPIARPVPSAFAPDLVSKGEMLAGGGNCMACHTARGSQPGAGGRPFTTAIGTFYSSNITPDAETGIGNWSEAAFTRALREGVARDGRHLFPVFPYDHFTKLTDADIKALYAYVMTRPPVKAFDRPNTVPFPLDVRALQAIWKMIYFKPGPYQPDPRRDAQWNRGAYLAQGLAACGACHTARNALGAESVGHPYGGPYGGALFAGWIATPLDVSPSPARWSENEVFAYLRSGGSAPHGVAVGPMRLVVKGLARLPDSDLKAIAAYFVSLNRPSGAALEPAIAKAMAPDPAARTGEPQGLKIYRANCAGCHDQGGVARSPLGLNASLWLEDKPHNFLRTVLDGIDGSDGLPGAMPAFRDKLTDTDLEALAAYLRSVRTNAPGWPGLDDLVRRIRTDSMSHP
jgi:mono/diheme cytochrome c family protein